MMMMMMMMMVIIIVVIIIIIISMESKARHCFPASEMSGKISAVLGVT